MNPIESDNLKRQAQDETLKVLAPLLGLDSISITEKRIQARIGRKIYYIPNSANSIKYSTELIKEIILTGSCEGVKVREI